MASDQKNMSQYWVNRNKNGLANWLMDYMDYDWYTEDFYEQLKQNGLGKLSDFASLDRESFDLKFQAIDWNSQQKCEFLVKFEQYFGTEKFPNIFGSPSNSMFPQPILQYLKLSKMIAFQTLQCS